jgi:predicted ATP-grasp superfamily ATP-dependent carboligase
VAERPWVLVAETYSQSRSAIAAVRALAAGGYRAAATTSSPISLAAASRHCARRVTVRMVEDPGYTEERFAESVRAEAAEHRYLAVLPTSDAALLALGSPFAHLVDKASMAAGAQAAELPMPPTRLFASHEDVLDAANDLEYPVVVKPAISRWAPFRADGPGELARVRGREGTILVQPFLEEGLRAVGGVVWQGRLVAAVHQRYLRTWPADCGTSCAAETVPPDLELEEQLLRLLRGYQGIFQAQLAGPYLLDVNLRPYGSLPLAVAAGANLPAIYCDLLRGREVRQVRGAAGVFYRWVEADLRRLWRAVRRGEMSLGSALRELRPRPGAAHSTESLLDPGPLLARLRFVAVRHDA